jgi:hypothetical protein
LTEAARRQHIEKALTAARDTEGLRDALDVPLRGTTRLEVIEVPLDIPVLNAESFRIAPHLEDDPRCAEVKADPHSASSQAAVAELVLAVHRHRHDLKENLAEEGQQAAGVITRDGVLINANTRCVLLRELAQEGRISQKTLRVGVLPQDVTEPELLELEMVLQQQVELKDEYRFISELMMVKKLQDHGLSDETIAKRRRLRRRKGMSGAQQVRERRQILMLMDRARHLLDPPLPLTAFDSDKDKLENWRDLNGAVNQLDQTEGAAAGDDHIRRWLIAYFSGADSVHRLRFATGSWVEDQLLDQLKDYKPLADAISGIAQQSTGGQGSDDEPDGLDMLGDESGASQTVGALDAVLQVVVAIKDAPDADDVELPGGVAVPPVDTKQRMQAAVEKALSAKKSEAKAGDRLSRPGVELRRATTTLDLALDAVESVREEPEFRDQAAEVADLIDQARELLDSIEELLDDVDPGEPDAP